MSSPLFWSQPLKYCAWAARERPAYFWSVVVGATGPALMPIVPPIRHMLGDVDPAPVPVTYPGTFAKASESATPRHLWGRIQDMGERALAEAIEDERECV
ncbi:hypothetical protein N5P37_007710 [Trichoderma harzianum]|nr:hypothetical protein N5P37_007710 [Trichoderma harzianum]